MYAPLNHPFFVVICSFSVQVGAATETELEDRKLRVEDAKNATFAAIEEGIVPGGGAALVHLSSCVPAIKQTIEDAEEKLGADIVQKVCELRLLVATLFVLV